MTFAFYGLLRKTVAADGLVGLFVETMLLLPVAAAYLAYLAVVGRSSFDVADPRMCLLLAASGVVTAIPLLLFAAAARGCASPRWAFCSTWRRRFSFCWPCSRLAKP